MKYTLGLDIGITSVGWAVLNLDDERIEKLGVRAFNAAEQPKTKESLAKPRREARSARRRLKRRAGRIKRAKELFVQYNLIPISGVNDVFETDEDKLNPWELRVRGLDSSLNGEELARALLHIIKRRGFKSNRKKAKSGKDEDGEMLKNISANREILNNYRTAGEMYLCDEKFTDKKRNSSGSYTNVLDRETLRNEIIELFKSQRGLSNDLASVNLEKDILECFDYQKPFASGEDIAKLVGFCTFEPTEKRAPKFAPTTEKFNLLQKINNLSYSDKGNKITLCIEDKQKIVELAYKQSEVKYTQIRKLLSLPDNARFTGLEYFTRPKKGQPREESNDSENKPPFFVMKGYHALRKVLETAGKWDEVKENSDLQDTILYALSFFKTDKDIQKQLEQSNVNPKIIEAALDCNESFDKSHSLSLKAMKKIIPFLELGMTYDKACAEAGYDHTNKATGDKRGKLELIPQELTTNPVAYRALTQSRKVVKSIIAKYGNPYRIHIEMARDMGKSWEKRNEALKRQKENEAVNNDLFEQFKSEFNREPKKDDLQKLRFYRDQNGQCAYTGKPIDLHHLFEPGYTEIDHILPYSRSMDDSRSNKVLVLWAENQHKRNQTPFEYIGHNPDKWQQFENWVHANIKDYKKREKLLMTNFDEKKAEEWLERNLNDTRYITREFHKYLQHNVKFSDPSVKKTIICVNGQVTARMRNFWGIKKVREENDLHHAVDAAVVASITDKQIQKVTRHAQVVETHEPITDPETGEILGYVENRKPRLPLPWADFRNELLALVSDNPKETIEKLCLPGYKNVDIESINPIMVSRMAQKRISGSLHAETIRSAKRVDSDSISVIRKPLSSLSEKDLGNLFDPEHNEKLYGAIRERMAQYGNDPKKAFAEPLRKPRNDTTPGPVVKNIKLSKTQNSGVKVRNGIADNGDMIRTDVFRKSGKYYLVPVYTSDFAKGLLPNKAIGVMKPLDSSYEFLYSLYPWEIIKVQLDVKDIPFFAYYKLVDSSTGAVSYNPLNNIPLDQKEKNACRFGARNAHLIEKYQISMLGEINKVRKEPRRGVENSSHIETGEAES